MKVLLLNQFFHPEVAAVAQIATDLAEDLVAGGIEVTAVAARGRYLGRERLPARESYRGVEIRRLAVTSLGKRTLAHRGIDYASFYASTALAMATLPRHDALVALTTPPLIAAAGLIARSFKKTKLVCWVQDLYPEVAIAFGVFGRGSPAARAMGAVSRRVLSRADRVVVLGEAMRERAVAAGAAPDRVAIIPNWADGDAVKPIPHAENPLRAELAQGAGCLVMYSGNIGRGHDVETLVGAAKLLRDRGDVAFLFLGDGAKRAELELAARGLPNVRLGLYRLRDELARSLSAADLHLVSLSPGLEGLIEPSKLYGIMAAGRPALFVGPERSEVWRTITREHCGRAFHNGDAAGLAGAIAALADDPAAREDMGHRGQEALLVRYSRRVATARFREVLRSL